MPPVVAAIGAVASAIGGAIGIGAAATGIMGVIGSLGASMLISTALSIGKSLLGGGRSAEPSRANLDRLRANIDVRTPRKTAVGITAFNTDIRDEEINGPDEDILDRFIVCASHQVQSYQDIFFDDKLAWTSAGGVQGEYVGFLYVDAFGVGGTGAVVNTSARMGTTRKYTGLAYVHLRFLTGDEESPFAQSVPSRITIRGRGAWVYDPREDSTVAGGAGPHRADNQLTWEWDDNLCQNPALVLLFYLLGWRIKNPVTNEWLLAVGKGIPKERIDMVSFAVAANICDELVSKPGGGTEPRYRCAGVWSEGDSPTTVIDMLKSTMNADLDDIDGQLRLTIFHNDLASYVTTFTEDDVLDEFEWEPDIPLDESFNIVRGVYTDPSDKSLYQPVDYPQVDSASPDGIDRILTLNLPMVQSVGQAQRLAQFRLARQLYGAGTFKATFQATAWRVQKNSVVRLTFPPLGFVNKLFRVAEMDLRVDGTVPLVLREESPSIYDPPTLFPALDPADPTPYDYTKSAWYKMKPAEPGANVTATNELRLYVPPDIELICDENGDILPGQPVALDFRFFVGDVDMSFYATYVWVTNGCTIVLGLPTYVDTVTANSATVTAKVTYGAVTVTGTMRVVKRIAPPQNAGGTGASEFAVQASGVISETVYDSTPHVLAQATIVTSASGTLTWIANLAYHPLTNGTPTFSFQGSFKVQVFVSGAWTDWGTFSGSLSEADFSVEPWNVIEGAAYYNVLAGFLPTSTSIDCRLIGIKTGGNSTGTIMGSFSGRNY